jgi:Hint domain
MTVTITGKVGQSTYTGSNAAILSVANGVYSDNGPALFVSGSNDVLTNTGTFTGISFSRSGTITNQVAGYIKPQISGFHYGLVITGSGSVTNFGRITGGGANVNGIILDNGGFVSNASTGTITGGIFVKGAAARVVNTGIVLGNTYGGNSYYGAVYLTKGGSVTNLTGGVITSVSTLAGQNYGVKIVGGAGTVTNAGTISGSGGGLAISLVPTAGNMVIDTAGAVFNGKVNGGMANSILELASGASTGTVSGLGTNFYNFGSVIFDSGSHWLVTANTVVSGMTFNGLSSNDTIDITGFTATSSSTLAGGLGLVLTNASAGHVTLKVGAALGGGFSVTTGAFGTDVTTVCFCRGTMILTRNGQVAVEHLAVGDKVVTLGHANARVITWIGKGRVLATRGKRSASTPVIVRKGALADNVPSLDLRITKAHALYIDGVLIPVAFLVNHKTILWDDHTQEVEIYHVELDQHDVLLANDTPAESYRDDGNRWLFQNANSGWHLPPQEPCALVLTAGPVVDEIWRRLLDRAGRRSLPPMTDDPDLHLMIDGTRVDAHERRGRLYVFRLATRPESVRIISRETVPAELGLARDPRTLGVAVQRVAFTQGRKLALINADDERLVDGFHDYEPADRLRWTNGDAALAAEVFAGFGKDTVLELHLGGATTYPLFNEDPRNVAA